MSTQALASAAVDRARDLRHSAAFGDAARDARPAGELRSRAPPARSASGRPRCRTPTARCLPACCGWAEADIRFIEPDVGGSFGARGEFYPEDFLIPWLAIRLQPADPLDRGPLRAFFRDQPFARGTFEVTAAADAGGIITAFDVRLVADLGAYIRTHGDVVPSHSSASFPGPYRVRNYRAQAIAALSNKTPCGTVRAPGMFEANFARERAVDLLADKLAIDRAEIRRRNLIRPDEMPWAVGTESVRRPTIFDSGDFPAVFERALSEFGWDRAVAAGRRTDPPGTRHRGPGRAIGVRAVRGRAARDRPARPCAGGERLQLARAGARDRPGAGRRRRPRRAARAHHGAPWRHRSHSVRRRKLCEPHRRHVGPRGAFGRRRREGEGDPDRGAEAGSRRRGPAAGRRPRGAGRRARAQHDARRHRPDHDPRQHRIAQAADPGQHPRPRRASRPPPISAPCPAARRCSRCTLAEVAVDEGTGQITRRALSGRRRRRPRDQSDAGRGPARRRRRAGAGRHAARGDRLRRTTASCRPGLSPITCCRRPTRRRRSRRW